MLRRRLVPFFRERLAQGLIEYSLLLGFIALAVIGLMSQAGSSVSGLWTSANSTIGLGSGNGAGSSGSGSGTSGGTGGSGGSDSGGGITRGDTANN